jgi:hypothetical protein
MELSRHRSFVFVRFATRQVGAIRFDKLLETSGEVVPRRLGWSRRMAVPAGRTAEVAVMEGLGHDVLAASWTETAIDRL